MGLQVTWVRLKIQIVLILQFASSVHQWWMRNPITRSFEEIPISWLRWVCSTPRGPNYPLFVTICSPRPFFHLGAPNETFIVNFIVPFIANFCFPVSLKARSGALKDNVHLINIEHVPPDGKDKMRY